jgi:hypothetical protein
MKFKLTVFLMVLGIVLPGLLPAAEILTEEDFIKRVVVEEDFIKTAGRQFSHPVRHFLFDG